MKAFLKVSVAVSGLLTATTAYAQDVPATTTATDSATNTDDVGLGAIVVTAQKRAENLQDVPIAVIAETGEQLVNIGVTNTMQLNTLAPGLNIRSTVGAFQPYIRGIGTSSSIVENPVALYVDGVYYPQQREGLVEFNDVDQISILKGPQGTLFGRNATAGVIQINTKGPRFDFGGSANVSYANYDTLHEDAFVTGPISDKVAFSLAGSNTNQGRGWGKNGLGQDTNKLDHQWSVRAKLLIEPTSTSSILFSADYMSRFAHSFSYQPFPGTEFFYTGKVATNGQIITRPPTSNPYDTAAPYDSTMGTKGGGLSMTFTTELPFAKLVSITAYRESKGSYDFDGAGVAPVLQLTIAPDQPSKMISEEIQLLSTSDGPLTWAAGLYYMYYDDAVDGTLRYRLGVPNPAGGFYITPTSNYSVGRQVVNSVAPFAQADFEIMPGTTLTLGARYNYETRRFTGSFNPAADFDNPVAGPNIVPQELTAKKPTFRVALNQEISPGVSVYASFNTGFKSGGFNIIAPSGVASAIANNQPTFFQPENLKAYELGFKSELFNHRVRLNAAGFYYDYKNIQVIQLTPAGQIILNGAGARIYGLDADMEASVAEGLRIKAGIALLDAKFTDFPNAPTNLNFSQNNAQLASLAYCNANPAVCNAKGNRLPLSQKISGNLSVDYDTPVSFGDLHFNITANYNGDYFFEPDNKLRQPAYTLLNSSIKWTSSDETYSLQLWGRNLLDKKVVTYTTSQTNYGYTTVSSQAPMTYGVTAGVKF